ncbi:transcriptional regulator TyrR [Salmonella enterica subsp. enterica]|nr:transcriptional regulator TyrR [Salmonella enterica subsp. enterica]
MRLEVFCEDRLGLTRELLDLLVLRSIDLRGIEIDPIGRIYLNFAELEFTDFSSLMAEIRRISGVTDVRTVPWMPSEREHLALSALLEALPEPVLSLDMKSKVEMANPASCQLFAQSQERMRHHTAAQLINGFNFQRWLDGNPQSSHNEHVVINGQNFLMEITPVHLQNENDEYVLTGAVVMLRSTIRMGQQLQNLSTQDLSAFSQIIAVSAKMKHVVEQAHKLAMLSAPLLITGDTGTGKDLFAYACHQASPRSAKPYLALNCASIPEDAVESELFGHAPEGKKGFFEQANGGSVLLDEIGEMSPRMQAKLLRFLIVGGSGQLNVLMSEISTTTREQEKGINQITLALNDLESATHSNVLMVEALSASSDVLKAQVIELQTKTDKFRLSQPGYSEHALLRSHVSPLSTITRRGQA